MASNLIGKKKALLLQGPIGSFFRTLAQTLEESGCEAFQVAFNAGDLANARWRNTYCYNLGRDNWRNWFEQFLIEKEISVVIIFGCERYQHSVARELCAKLNIPVLALEEGYIRPGYITAEWGGNNWRSPAADLPVKTILKTKRTEERSTIKRKNFGKIVWLGFLYYNIRALGRPYFSRAMYHKTRPIVPEALKWIRNYYRWLTGKKRNRETADALLGSLKGSFFFIPLQVSDDQQLTEAGEGWDNDKLIKRAVSSFLSHAPADTLLVFKLHPMERGHSNDLKRIQQFAARNNASHRILVIDDGPLGELVKVSRGMITINSTSGLSALLHQVPIAVLGKAIYRRPELATCIETQSDLDQFWTTAKACDPKIAEGFRNCLFNIALLPGDYYLDAHRQEAADEILQKISA